jgi:hypothetical protein
MIGGWHWARTSNPFIMKLGNNLTTDTWKGYLRSAAGVDANNKAVTDGENDWNQEETYTNFTYDDTADFSIEPGGTLSNLRKCRPTAGRVEVCNYTYGKTGWVGLTSAYASSNHITQASVKLNDTYLNRSGYNNKIWRLGTLCHELGHTLGLDHVEKDSCMDSVSNPTLADTYPNQHDYEQLMDVYGHCDSSSGCTTGTTQGTPTAQSPSTAQKKKKKKKPPPRIPRELNEIDFSDERQWGRLIEKRDREEVYERTFSSGHKVFNFVILAKEEDQLPQQKQRQKQPEEQQSAKQQPEEQQPEEQQPEER